jgi:hypothetical protein
MVGFSETSSCQRVPVPRYFLASCQRVSPEDMRIEAAFPPTLRFGATSPRSVAGCASDNRCGLDGRAGAGFIEAKGMAAIASGYGLLDTFDGREMADWLVGVWLGAAVNAVTGLLSGVDGAAVAIAASSSRFLAR